MSTSVLLKAIAIWLAIVILAFLNGILREKALLPIMGSFAGLVASGIFLSIFILGVAYIAAPWYGPLTSRQWILVGLAWLLLTVAFEFGFGMLIQHKSLSELLDAYTFRDGNLWPLVLVTTFLSPWLSAKFRGLM